MGSSSFSFGVFASLYVPSSSSSSLLGFELKWVKWLSGSHSGSPWSWKLVKKKGKTPPQKIPTNSNHLHLR